MKRLTLLTFALTFSIQAMTQTISEPVVNAFSASYQAETAKEWDRAISSLKAVYSDQSYETNARLGWLCYSRKDYAQAARYYQTASKLKPKSLEALLGYANSEAGLQNWDQVFETYKKMLGIDPNNTTANYRIALMYCYRKDYQSAQAHLQKVLDLYPFDYESMLLMAQAKVAAGKITEAKSWYQKVLLFNPSDTSIRQVLNKL